MVSCEARGVVCACQVLPTTTGLKSRVCRGPLCVCVGVCARERLAPHVLCLRVGGRADDNAQAQICIMCDCVIRDVSVRVCQHGCCASMRLCVSGMRGL